MCTNITIVFIVCGVTLLTLKRVRTAVRWLENTFDLRLNEDMACNLTQIGIMTVAFLACAGWLR